MLRPEVRPQVHNLPGPKTDEQPCGADAEPLDTGVCRLVGVAELLLALAEVLHLADDLASELLDAAELGLDGLELLRGLNGGPVLCVGTNVDVELDGAGCWVGATGCDEYCVRIVRACMYGCARECADWRAGYGYIQPDMMFSKQTSKAASACDVKTVLDSPTISLGRPYSLPTASRI